MTAHSIGRRHNAATGHSMIEAVAIKNFRLFKDVSAKGFRRINIVVGDNRAGKTSFLEALFAVAATSSDFGPRFRHWRNMGEPGTLGPATPQEVYDGFYQSLFFGFDKELVIEIEATGTDEDSRRLRIFYDQQEPVSLPYQELSMGSIGGLSAVPVVSEFTDASGRTTKSTAQVSTRGITFPPANQRATDSTFLAARMPFVNSENAKWFSDLSKSNREKEFIGMIRDQFPEIDGISVEIDLGTQSLYARLNWSKKKIPLSLHSDGMQKLTTVLLHIAHASGATTYIDEIENGLHFSRHERFWQQILLAAKTYNTQLFASTHSLEFLRKAVPVLEQNPDEFSLVRLYQRDGVGNIAVVTGEDAFDLISAGLEVRS